MSFKGIMKVICVANNIKANVYQQYPHTNKWWTIGKTYEISQGDEYHGGPEQLWINNNNDGRCKIDIVDGNVVLRNMNANTPNHTLTFRTYRDKNLDELL